MIRWLTPALAFVVAILIASPTFAEKPSSLVSLHVFVREECVHCIAEKAFLKELSSNRTDIQVILHDIAFDAEREIFESLVALTKAAKATPLTFINGTIIQGFSTADTTGKRIIAAIDGAHRAVPVSLDDFLAGKVQASLSAADAGCDETGATPCTVSSTEYLVHIPLIGTVDMQRYSLPIIAAILGFVDGFNPCAMWVLVTFLLILLQLGDRRKVWQVAGLFIAAETIMYYMILNVWFTAWDFIGLDRIITPIVGIVAIAAGSFFLYEAITSAGQCKVTSVDQRKRTHLRIQNIASMPFTLMSAIAVIGLALSVNIIEFACSVGIPQTFTKILDLNGLSFASRQGMMAIYILMYMFDDFLVFGLALWSTENIHRTHKYSRACNIIGGVLMILLGALLIFAPTVLVFG